jgi:GT2 family glycosyltransferase
LKTLVSAAQQSPTFGILSPIHLQADKRSLDQQFAGYVSPPKCDFFKDLYRNNVLPLYKCNFVNAAAWLISRDCITKVGVFEPLFFLYGEDLNYIQRMKYHGLLVGVVPSAKVVHDRADRGGKKSLNGTKIEVSTYILVRMLNVNNSLPANILDSTKVFVKHGINFRSITNYISVLFRVRLIKKRINKYKVAPAQLD